MAVAQVPETFRNWFSERNWTLRKWQREMVSTFNSGGSKLLVAPTGAGKTLAGFLPSLIDLHRNSVKGLHTIYISPLKALTNDIERNLGYPVSEMGLDISVESRTGDTPAHKRQRQRRSPPNILLTTPESLMLMLSYADAERIFKHLRCVVVDEAHSLANTKRGDFTSLCMARLEAYAPDFVRFGLSATVAEPERLAKWLVRKDSPCQIEVVKETKKARIKILKTKAKIPHAGFMAKYALPDVYKLIEEARITLLFVNTRAQAELVFQQLWELNIKALPIAIYHGSLSKEQRRKTESMMAQGVLSAIVSTSALELGIDWGDVDLVVQIGAPKGICRLLQRIGRSNHTMEEPSKAVLVPANRFEALECQAAVTAINNQERDSDFGTNGALEIIPQFIVNCLCSDAASPDDIYQQIRTTESYAHLDRNTFEQLWRFTIDGGYALQAYDRFKRIAPVGDGKYKVISKVVMQKHRQNIGTIVEASRLKVKRLRRSHQGKVVGEVEEYFAQQLVKGDTFLFAGEVLRFEGIKDMIVEARPVKNGEPKIPSYVGGQLPLSTYLADGVRDLLNEPTQWRTLPNQVQEWLRLQQSVSQLPTPDSLLIEHFTWHKQQQTIFYTFEGRKANQTLGMLVTKRMEKMGLKPISFCVTDYGLSVRSIHPFDAGWAYKLVQPDIMGDELEDWMLESPMLKRSFKRVAMISGLTEQNYHSNHRSMRQVTFSTDLIYDVLREYDKDHILLRVTRDDAETELLDVKRLSDMLIRFVNKLTFIALDRPSPLSIPIMFDARSEQVRGTGVEALLQQASIDDEAELLMRELQESVKDVA